MQITDPIEKLNLVGPVYGKRLNKLNITTLYDLLYHFPFRYEDFTKISPISALWTGNTVTISATIESIKSSFTKTGKRAQKAVVFDDSGKIEIIWFNQMYLEKVLKKDCKYNFSGKVEFFGHQKTLISPDFEELRENCPPIHTGRLVPVYPETYGVSSKWLRSRINYVFKYLNLNLEEYLPKEIIEKERLIEELNAIKKIHFPDSLLDIHTAKTRLAFDEMFLLQLSAMIRKQSWNSERTGKKLVVDQQKIGNYIKSLPFELTNAQKRVVDEVLNDLTKDTPANRLIEGDVGSGKTVVAAIGAYAVFLNGLDSLIMAPTEILAQQHYLTLKSLLSPVNIPIELVTGSKKIKTQNLNIKDQKYGKIDNNVTPKIIVGTHSLLFQEFDKEKIGMVVIDEQHRFGVEQRKILSEKGFSPHSFTMTATPIPRTIALTLFGDLDLSVIDEMPKGRIRIKTWVVPNEKRLSSYEWIRKRVKDTPEQAFIVCPLIEESESLTTIKSSKKEFDNLSKKIFPDLRLGLLHGKMKSKEKEEILDQFKKGDLDILVSTPVVEVGIDIPNATIMLIEGADRFGLAQLHQLRGRVGRSDMQSYCFLFTENTNPLIVSRLKSMEEADNGMKLAEIDLKLRGPGDVYGIKQHGFFDLKSASFTDIELINKTRIYAQEMLKEGIQNNCLLKSKLEKYKIATVNN